MYSPSQVQRLLNKRETPQQKRMMELVDGALTNVKARCPLPQFTISENTTWGPNMRETPWECARARASLLFCYGMSCFWTPDRIFRNRLFRALPVLALHS